MRLTHSVVAALLLCGCGGTPVQQVAPQIDAGPPPTPEAAEQAARRHLARLLKDPDSLKQFAMLGSPHCVKWYRGAFRTGGMDAGWQVRFEYNAKNSYGGYVGVTPGHVVMRGADPLILPSYGPMLFPCS